MSEPKTQFEDEGVARGCDYIGHEFGASYPDSVCCDGWLWDADSCDEPGGPLTHGGDMPCPQCNHETWLQGLKEEIENQAASAVEDGVPITENPFNTIGLKFEHEREMYKEWWRAAYQAYADTRNVEAKP